MKTITNIIYPAFAVFTLACFALSPTARAVGPPPPDGGYPNGNTAEGDFSLQNLTTGNGNTAIGESALYNTTTGTANTATGYHSMFYNTEGSSNTATGVSALQDNTTGNQNTATGQNALNGNTTGSDNTGSGFQALLSNTTGGQNTATGFEALYNNTTGELNTANGFDALYSNTTGELNTASGVNTLYNNTTGHRNTATGLQALYFNTTGARNTATGTAALFNNTTGDHNAAHGWAALFNNTTGNLNIAVGDTAGALLIAGNNNIDIANAAVAAESNTIRIGNVVPFTDLTNLVHPVHTATYIAGISGATVAKSAAVFIDANGRLGTKSSSQRFKDEIKPMDKASEAIHALTPVTFRYKNEIDPDGTPQFGLVAEDVAKVNPDLVVRDAEGKIHTVRYDAVNAMLLNEFLKDHRKVEEQDATISQLKKDFRATVAELTARLKEQDSKIEKVGAQFEVSKPARQMVANNQ